MSRYKRVFTLSGSVIIILILILHGKSAIYGAKEGISLCIASVIPSLFPFITFTYILNSILTELSWKPLSPLFRFCGIPEGGESLLVLGLLGGYPVGAQAINEAYKNKRIAKQQGECLMAFCSNAGPAFIFGVTPYLFENETAPWAIWGIHILSAVIVSQIVHKNISACLKPSEAKKMTLPLALKKSLYTVSTICGWVILFRTFQGILEKHTDNLLPAFYKSVILGSAELTSGFYSLLELNNQSTGFVLANVLLSFGGVCVMMQTASVTEELGLGLYFPGKTAQCAISYFLSSWICPLIFKETYFSLPLTLLFGTILIISIIILRKNSRFISKNAV